MYLAIDFKPNISLSMAFDHRTDGHQTNDEGLSFLDRDVHLLPDIWTSQEVPSWNHADNVL